MFGMAFVNILKVLVGLYVGSMCGLAMTICLTISKKKVVRLACILIVAVVLLLVQLIAFSVPVLCGEVFGFIAAVFFMSLARAASDGDEVVMSNVE